MTSTPSNARVHLLNRDYFTPFQVSYANALGREVPYSAYKENYKGHTGTFNSKGGNIHLDLVPINYSPPVNNREYIYVESFFPFTGVAESGNHQKEIISSSEYKRNKRLKKVALKAPDSCINQQSSATDIKVNEAQSFIKNRCSVEMNLIEKELTKNGFSVYSWEMLYSSFKEGNNSYLKSAKLLGADILFIINSIESLTIESDSTITQRNYFKGNENFEKEAVLKLSSDKIDCLDSILSIRENSLKKSAFGASVNITAVEVKTGKSFWFYQNNSYNLKDNLITSFFKIDKLNDESFSCSSHEKEKPKKDNTETSYSFEYNINYGKVRKLDTIKKAISEFVDSFIVG